MFYSTVNRGIYEAKLSFDSQLFLDRQWLPCAGMKQGRVCHALAVGGGNIYALGGRSKNPPGTVGSNATDGKVIDTIEKYAVQVSFQECF